jgi:hypothetical protein
MTQMVWLLASVKLVILLLGGWIAFVAYRTYLQTDSQSFRVLAFGFGMITVGGVVSGFAHQILGVAFQTEALIDGTITAVGFAIIALSLYLKQ